MIEGRVQGVVLKRFIRSAMFDDSVFCDHDVFFRLLVAIAIDYIYYYKYKERDRANNNSRIIYLSAMVFLDTTDRRTTDRQARCERVSDTC